MALEDRLAQLRKCLERLREVLGEEKNPIVRDSAIKRFELCFEVLWKSLKDYLEREGILCRSPRGCLKEAFSLGLIDDQDEWLSILNDRNLSVHVYLEELAEEIFERLPSHLKAMETLLAKLEKELF
ncbi:HI0074 family nucleotidyltransferase substrate-binding subunit [Thermovibrio sp.]